MVFDSRKPSWRDHLGKAAIAGLVLFAALAIYIGRHEGDGAEPFIFLAIVAAVVTIGLGGAWAKDRRARKAAKLPPHHYPLPPRPSDDWPPEKPDAMLAFLPLLQPGVAMENPLALMVLYVAISVAALIGVVWGGRWWLKRRKKGGSK